MIYQIDLSRLTKERQIEILNRLKINWYNKFIRFKPFDEKIIQKIKYRKLLKSKTLAEFISIRQELNEKGICFGEIYETLTEPFIGMSLDELYSLGIEKENIDAWYRLNKGETND